MMREYRKEDYAKLGIIRLMPRKTLCGVDVRKYRYDRQNMLLNSA